MSCDDINKYSLEKLKGSESPSFYLDHEAGRCFTLLEEEMLGGAQDYDRARSSGGRRRDRTPTHGETRERSPGRPDRGLRGDRTEVSGETTQRCPGRPDRGLQGDQTEVSKETRQRSPRRPD